MNDLSDIDCYAVGDRRVPKWRIRIMNRLNAQAATQYFARLARRPRKPATHPKRSRQRWRYTPRPAVRFSIAPPLANEARWPS